jgi:hypothetical protein
MGKGEASLMRQCGDCSLCCKLLPVRSLAREMEQRIVIRLGGLMVVVGGALFGALHAWPSH